MILSTNDQIYTWGLNSEGQCGQPSSERIASEYASESPSFSRTMKLFTPCRVAVEQVTRASIKDLQGGQSFSGFLTDTGDVFTFGDNSEGQLGIGSTMKSSFEPSKIRCDDRVSQFSLGHQHMLLLTYSGRVLGAGRNREYQLGLAAPDGEAAPNALTP